MPTSLRILTSSGENVQLIRENPHFLACLCLCTKSMICSSKQSHEDRSPNHPHSQSAPYAWKRLHHQRMTGEYELANKTPQPLAIINVRLMPEQSFTSGEVITHFVFISAGLSVSFNVKKRKTQSHIWSNALSHCALRCYRHSLPTDILFFLLC